MGTEYNEGANLVGNPYQAYLDLSQITTANSALTHFYIYDADQGVYAPVVDGSSDNPVIPSKHIHPHQAFFVLAPEGGTSVTLTPSMADTTRGGGDGSHYRDDDHVNYPLVNLFVENAIGQRDLTVVEMNRPTLGGVSKINYLKNANFAVAAHLDGTSYGILFAPDGINRVPVRFSTEESGTFKMSWETHNGVFSELRLIDNKTGANYDMLAHDSYSFEASVDDYSSRFYIVFSCSGMGVDENEDDGSSIGSGTFAYIGTDGNIVIDMDAETCHGASLQVIDVMGRVLHSTTVNGEMHAISTSGLAKGVYLLRLTKGNMMRTQKIVVR
jgi:hypothetical protein